MLISGAIMMILFAFILFILGTVVASFFIKPKIHKFEPSISIIIPCYNEEKNIKKCIYSISKANYPKTKLEVIVIDDGSIDNTRKILSKSGIKLINSEHVGKSAALNLGVNKARYDFILALDADTTIDKNFIKNIVKPFEDKKVGATNGSCLAKSDNNMLETFQKIEYFGHSMIRKAFSDVYSNGLWFFWGFFMLQKISIN